MAHASKNYKDMSPQSLEQEIERLKKAYASLENENKRLKQQLREMKHAEASVGAVDGASFRERYAIKVLDHRF